MKTRVIVLSTVLTLALASFAAAQAMRNVQKVTIDEVKALMAKNAVILVDVRDPQSFAAGHIPGALNVPFDFIPNHVEAWKKDPRLIVTYCACGNEVTAVRAVVDMNAFEVKNAKALLGGWNEWVKRGERVEK
jgi:phage shock protein E